MIKACIIGLGNHRRGGGKSGHRVRLSVRDAAHFRQGGGDKSKQLPLGLIVRTRQTRGRRDGSYISFGDNACILISKNKPKASAIEGPIPFDIRHNSKFLAKALV